MELNLTAWKTNMRKVCAPQYMLIIAQPISIMGQHCVGNKYDAKTNCKRLKLENIVFIVISLYAPF